MSTWFMNAPCTIFFFFNLTDTYDLGSPIDCKWTDYTEWSECSQSCEGGIQTRERTIEILARNGGQPCRGETREKRQCNTHKCPRRFNSFPGIDRPLPAPCYLNLLRKNFYILYSMLRKSTYDILKTIIVEFRMPT